MINTRDNLENVLTEREKKLIRMIHTTEFGEFKVIIQDKQPIRIEELKKSIKL